MNHMEFEQFVLDNGKDILRFCRMTCGNNESGDELYQDTMLKLLEKLSRLDFRQNVKSYALSISILLWKNKKNGFITILPGMFMTFIVLTYILWTSKAHGGPVGFGLDLRAAYLISAVAALLTGFIAYRKGKSELK